MKKLIALAFVLSTIQLTATQLNQETACDFWGATQLKNKILSSGNTFESRANALHKLYSQTENEAEIFSEFSKPLARPMDWTLDDPSKSYYMHRAIAAKQKLACLREIAKKHSLGILRTDA